LLPLELQPDHLLGVHIPGLGFIITLSLILFLGMIVSNFIGKYLLSLWEMILGKIPFVRGIYSSVKQVLQTIFSSDAKAFRKVLLVRYPHPDSWTMAFLTSEVSNLHSSMPQKKLMVYVPTTPNPTSGFLLLYAPEDVKELNISVEAALKMIISLGVVQN
jgi:uncharacterized membrane protein